MEKNDIFASNGKALGANVLGALCVESFLSENYRFRRNVLNGKVEFASLEAGVTVGQGPVTSDDRDQSPALCTSAFQPNHGRMGG